MERIAEVDRDLSLYLIEKGKLSASQLGVGVESPRRKNSQKSVGRGKSSQRDLQMDDLSSSINVVPKEFRRVPDVLQNNRRRLSLNKSTVFSLNSSRAKSKQVVYQNLGAS